MPQKPTEDLPPNTPPAAPAAQPGQPPPVAPNRLEGMVIGSEILITYACRNAIKPADLEDDAFKQLIQEVIIGREKYRQGAMTEEIEAKFVDDFRRLSRVLRPVTVKSIQDSVAEEGRGSRRFFLWGPYVSAATAAVTRFTFISILALAALLWVQIVWLIGFNLLEQIKTLEKKKTTVTQTQPPEGEAGANAGKTGATNESNATKTEANGTGERVASTDGTSTEPPLRDANEVSKGEPTRQKLTLRRKTSDTTEELNVEAQRRAAFQMLRDGWFAWPGAQVDLPEGKTVTTADEILALNNSVVIASASIVNILQTYALPLLYGLVGACTYVLRQVVAEMRDRVYRSESEIAYWVRIFLGLLAGLAIGWFLRPDPDKGDLLSGLPPFAVSYAAGYSVELLFTAMDRIVQAFGATSQQSKS
jgi:hypothetical protein